MLCSIYVDSNFGIKSTVTQCRLHTHTHTRLTAFCPGLPGWAGTRKVKPIWILLKQEIVSGSGISWAIRKSAPRSRQITKPAPHHSSFLQAGCLPAAQPTASKQWRLKHWRLSVDESTSNNKILHSLVKVFYELCKKTMAFSFPNRLRALQNSNVWLTKN